MHRRRDAYIPKDTTFCKLVASLGVVKVIHATHETFTYSVLKRKASGLVSVKDMTQTVARTYPLTLFLILLRLGNAQPVCSYKH